MSNIFLEVRNKALKWDPATGSSLTYSGFKKCREFLELLERNSPGHV